MHAWLCTNPTGVDALAWTELPTPTPQAGEVLIEIKAASLNFPDLLIVQNKYQMKPPLPFVPGSEYAGVVQAVGEGVTHLKVGQNVACLSGTGGFGTHTIAPATLCMPLPEGFSYVDAAAFIMIYATSHHALVDRAQLKAGETVLVLGAAGGVGTAAIQIAKAMGARVIVTAGSDDKCAACLKLGADHAINYKTQDFKDEAKRLTDGKGVDVILDMVGGSYVAREVECLAEDGRIVIIAVQGGVKSEFNAGLVLRKRLTITGSTLRPRPIAFKQVIAQACLKQVWPLIEAGKIKPVIHSTFAAVDASDATGSGAAKAHALMESNQHVGKIVLTWKATA